MKPIKSSLAVAVSALLLAVASPASALNITADYSDLTNVWQTASGRILGMDPGGATDITGIFRSNVSAAFTYLGNSVRGGGDLTVRFGLEDLQSLGADGYSQVITLGPNGLPTVTRIVLDNSSASTFYADATPFDNSEYTMTFDNATLGGGIVNVGRYGTAVPNSAAEQRTDILTLVMHELIHSAFLKADTPEGNQNRKLTIPALLTGFTADFDLPFLDASNHIDPVIQGGVFRHTVTSEPSFGNNDRWLLTGVEVYGICVIQGCTADQVNPDLISSIPEPSAVLLMTSGLGFTVALRRRRQLQA